MVLKKDVIEEGLHTYVLLKSVVRLDLLIVDEDDHGSVIG
jgi:hypothetical protein